MNPSHFLLGGMLASLCVASNGAWAQPALGIPASERTALLKFPKPHTRSRVGCCNRQNALVHELRHSAPGGALVEPRGIRDGICARFQTRGAGGYGLQLYRLRSADLVSRIGSRDQQHIYRDNRQVSERAVHILRVPSRYNQRQRRNDEHLLRVADIGDDDIARRTQLPDRSPGFLRSNDKRMAWQGRRGTAKTLC